METELRKPEITAGISLSGGKPNQGFQSSKLAH